MKTINPTKITKKDAPSTSMVSPRGEDMSKAGSGGKQEQSKVMRMAAENIPPGGSEEGKTGTGGTLDFAGIKRMAAETITDNTDEGKSGKFG